MVSSTTNSLHRAILFLGVAFLLLATTSWAKESWFKAKGPVGSQERNFLVRFQEDQIELYKGGHRLAPGVIAGQTYTATRYVLSGHYPGTDTLFWWHTVLVMRWEKGQAPQLVWQNTARGGKESNDWSRILYTKSKPTVEFHSPFYGDGEHGLEAGVIPNEALPLLAIEALRTQKSSEWKVLAAQWEAPYTRQVNRVKIEPTTQTVLIDDVQARLVQFLRDDQAIAEAWISVDGYQILRYRTFRGVWLEKLSD